MPALSIFLLRSFGFISNLELTKRQERLRPFLFIAFYYIASSYLFSEKLGMGPVFMTIMQGGSILIIALMIVTLWFKISIHATAIWSAVGYVSALAVFGGVDLGNYYFALILAAGITSTSRLALGYHAPKEVWAGILIGFAYSFLTMLALI